MKPGWLLVLVLLLPASALAARGPRLDVRVESLPGVLRTGETVVLHWDDLPREVEQIELVLSLDDGRRFTTRISPELSGRTTTWRWRVPEMTADRARLVIRAVSASGERQGVPSVAFRIEPGDARDADREDPMWMEFGAGDSNGLPGGSMTSATEIVAGRETPALASAPAAPLVPRGVASRHAPLRCAALVAPDSPRLLSSASSRRVPLRN